MKCKGCGRKPHEITEYILAAMREGVSIKDYVRLEEGTFNPATEEFYCTSCYIKAGMPEGKT